MSARVCVGVMRLSARNRIFKARGRRKKVRRSINQRAVGPPAGVGHFLFYLFSQFAPGAPSNYKSGVAGVWVCENSWASAEIDFSFSSQY